MTDSSTAQTKPPTQPTLEGLPTPEDIAAITEKAMASSMQAADDLRAVGSMAKRMAELLDDNCGAAANDCLQRAGGISDTFKGFAFQVLEHGKTVQALRQRVEQSRQIETDFYGLKRGVGSASPVTGSGLEDMPRVVTGNGNR